MKEKEFEKEVMVLFFKIMREHVAAVELRDLYTAQFKKALLAYAKYNYIAGSNSSSKTKKK